MKRIDVYKSRIIEKIDKKDDFYRCIKPYKDFKLKEQEEIAKYILEQEENAFINSDVLNLFQIPKEFVEKVNINSHIIKSHLKTFNDKKLYKLTSKDAEKSDQSEKTICKRLWQQTFEYNRYKKGIKPNKKIDILDFEVPVIYSKYDKKTKGYTNRKCSGNGAVDIVAKDGNVLYLIEAKDYKSKESILRCITEIKTYYEKIINHKEQDTEYISAKELLKYSYQISKIVPAIMIFEGTQPYDDFKEISKEISDYKYLKRLASGITFFKIECKNCKRIKTNLSVDKLKSLYFTFKTTNIK